MKKTITVLCILLCFLLVGWIYFWKNQKQDEEKIVEILDPCTAEWGYLTWWEFWKICIFDDGSFCDAESFQKWVCKKWERIEEVKYSENESLLYCPVEYHPVCWEDGHVYMNSCILERQWLAQSKTQKVVKWTCVPMDESEIAALNEETWSTDTWSVELWNIEG